MTMAMANDANTDDSSCRCNKCYCYYIGGDVSKGYCNFVIMDQDRKIIENDFQLDDTPKGHQKLLSILTDIRTKSPDALIFAGFESTGGYENNWYQLLWKLKDTINLQVTRLNPLGVKHHKIANLNRMDNDEISAQQIADYLISHPNVPVYNYEDTFASIRRQWKFIRLLKKQKAQLKQQLESMVYEAHPQMLKYWDEQLSEWFLQVLINYPTAKELAIVTVKKLSAIPYLTEDKARQLIQDARISVASATKPWMGHCIKSLAQQILVQKKTIMQLEKEMLESYSSPEINILTSFKGIGSFSAFGLMIEIGSIERYRSVKNLASHFGVNPVFKASGDKVLIARMSKKGRKEPRWILYNVALSAIVHNEMIRELYEGYLKGGKAKMSAVGIIMHKILRIIYGMLKHRTNYDPEIDKVNRNREVSKKCDIDKDMTKPKTDKSRRYQSYDNDAPISKRQSKKREEAVDLKESIEAPNERTLRSKRRE